MDSPRLSESLTETLSLFDGSGTPLTTAEVAENLDVGRRSTYDRLERLVDSGELETKKVGASARIWWRPRPATRTDDAAATTSPPVDGTGVASAVLGAIDQGVFVLDEDQHVTWVNDACADLLGYEPEDLRGVHCSRLLEDSGTDGISAICDQVGALAASAGPDAAGTTAAPATFDVQARRADGNRFSCEVRFTAIRPESGSPTTVGVIRNVTDREARERELELSQRVRQQEVVAALGQRALEDLDLDTLLDEATATVAETLDAAYCKVLDLDADAGGLMLRQGVGWDDGLVGSATVSAHDDDSQAGHTLATDEPIVVEDLETETRFSGPDLLTDHDVRSGISTIIGPSDDPWGILGVHDTRQREFPEHAVTFLQSVAHVIASAVARDEYEHELRWQREQLVALHNLNAVVHRITDAVIAQSTREEIETTVCEHLADTPSYRFAWIGEGDVASRTVTVRAQAGAEGFLDDTEISVDPDDERSAGPTGRALRTGEVQTTQDVHGDERYRPWRENAEEFGVESVVAVPIAYDDTVYGVLNVYADRQHAFEGQELEVIAQLGEIVAHAIAAADRKRALMGDEVVEVEFQILDLFEELPTAADGTITLGHAIPVGDDEFVIYGSTTPDGVDTLRALVEAVPHWTDVTVRESDDGARFELHVVDAPVLSVVASMGGSIERAVIEDGDYFMTVHLSPSVDVRTLIDAVTRAYPRAEMVKRRQVERTDRAERVRDVLHEDITERQRTALEAAFHAGFFEWPRDTSGEEVATALGISPSTFHQHLRAAEQKIVASLLSPGASRPDH